MSAGQERPGYTAGIYDGRTSSTLLLVHHQTTLSEFGLTGGTQARVRHYPSKKARTASICEAS